MESKELTKSKYNQPWRYAISMFGIAVLSYCYFAYGPFFYSEAGLSTVAIGVGSMIFSIWDVFNDPIAGVLSDRTRTRFGRRKPWILACMPIYMLSFVLFFSPPKSLGNGVGLAIFFTVFLILIETSNTITNVNYHSLLPELFRDTNDRNRANAIRQVLQIVGMILGVSLVPSIAKAIGYPMTSVILAVIGGGAIVFSILGCRERKDFIESPTPPFLPSLAAIAQNRNFWFVSVTHLLYQSTSALLLAGMPFFVKYSLQLSDSASHF